MTNPDPPWSPRAGHRPFAASSRPYLSPSVCRLETPGKRPGKSRLAHPRQPEVSIIPGRRDVSAAGCQTPPGQQIPEGTCGHRRRTPASLLATPLDRERRAVEPALRSKRATTAIGRGDTSIVPVPRTNAPVCTTSTIGGPTRDRHRVPKANRTDSRPPAISEYRLRPSPWRTSTRVPIIHSSCRDHCVNVENRFHRSVHGDVGR